jgi:hypothetical protein
LANALADHPDRRVWHRAALLSGEREDIALELEQAGARARQRGAIAVAVTASRSCSLATLAYVKHQHSELYLAFCVVVRLEPVAAQRTMTTCDEGLRHTRAAVAYAERMHAGQQRTDGTPFILHPLEVGSLLHSAGAPDHLIAAGVLHDLIEKTHASAGDLQERFGPRITRLVLAVSDDDQIAGYANRKTALRQQVAGAGDQALTLFAADKLSKVRELRRETAADSENTTPGQVRNVRARRLKHYHRSLVLLEERIPTSPLVRELHDELDALLHERATLAVTR